MVLETAAIKTMIQVYYIQGLNETQAYDKIKSVLTIEDDLLVEETLKSNISDVYKTKPKHKDLSLRKH
jgi:hypothetical protein